MSESQNKVDLKNPVLAAILAFLIPGAGHLYQGRKFKAAIYCFCILSTFFCGMALGDWKAVYYQSEPGKRNLGYFAQVGVGLPALPALVQTSRYNRMISSEYRRQFDTDSNYLVARADQIPLPFETTFKGSLLDRIDDGSSISGQLEGRIKFNSVSGEFGPEVTGTFEGTLDNKPIETLDLANPGMGLPLGGNQQRVFQCDVIREVNGRKIDTGHIEGSIPRPFLNWFEMPLNKRELDDINKKLGKRYEFAVVFTWIAGLLNLLVIWDAFEGPAYGRGDEEEAASKEKEATNSTT